LEGFIPHSQDHFREAAGIARLDLAEENHGIGPAHHAGDDLLLDLELELFDLVLMGVLVVQDEEDGGVKPRSRVSMTVS
jgi:hypothetical protein